uniref:Uncharacterized protein n=1 Tax=Vespula pensylvanica TaxID=30213 RepID=A0A834K8J4_VESPE|nr:hypothetical protein H0235_015509 [Vespula pensylvanica]
MCIGPSRSMKSLLGSFFAIMLINGELTEYPVTISPLLLTTNFINTKKKNDEETTKMPSSFDVAFRGVPEDFALGAIIVAPQIECDAGHKRDGNGICRPVTF